MSMYLLKLVRKFSKVLQERYPVVTIDSCEDGLYHIGFYLKYGWIFPPIFFLQIFYRELIEDKHLSRIIKGTETPEQLLDLKADLITRLTGLLSPAILWAATLPLLLILI